MVLLSTSSDNPQIQRKCLSGSRPPQISHSMGPDTWGWLFNGPTGRPEVWVYSPDGNLNSEMNQRPHSEATL